MTMIAGIEVAHPRGLAGSNSVNRKPAVRISCSVDEVFQKGQDTSIRKHIILKRLTDPHGAREKQLYITDEALNARLNQWAAQQTPPYPDPEGYGTNRIPVRLLVNDPRQSVLLRREMRVAEPLLCSCIQWREKTAAEAKAQGLAWPIPEDQEDNERYSIGTATWCEYRDEEMTGKKGKYTVHHLVGKSRVTCDPHTCPYATGKDAKGLPTKEGVVCGPKVDILCALGSWTASELAFAHAQSWSTSKRILTGLKTVWDLTGGILAGIEMDLVLAFTEPLPIPGGKGKKRQPYWTLEVPWGMSDEEFQEATIAAGKRRLANVKELSDLYVQHQLLLSEQPWRNGALLNDWTPRRALPPASDLEAPPEAPLVASEQQAVDELVAGGRSPEEARALVVANADALDEFMERAVPEGDAQEPLPPPPDVLEGDFAPIPDDAPFPGDEDAPEPVLEPPAPEPEPEAVAPMFPAGCPETADPIRLAFVALDQTATLNRILNAAWHKMTGTARDVIPTPGNCTDPDQYAAVLADIHRRAEIWWRQTGSKLGEGGAQ